MKASAAFIVRTYFELVLYSYSVIVWTRPFGAPAGELVYSALNSYSVKKNFGVPKGVSAENGVETPLDPPLTSEEG